MPAICIAERLLAEGHQILLLTDKRGAKLIPAHLPYKRLASASPFSGSVMRRLGAMIQLAGGLVSCLITLARKAPYGATWFWWLSSSSAQFLRHGV
jgi:hypothetical protein